MEIATAISVFVDKWFREPEADRPALIKELAAVFEPAVPVAPVVKKSKKVELPKCAGLTAKGKPCSRKVSSEGDTYCKLHVSQATDPPKAKAAPKKAKAKKEPKPAPEHNHEIGEEAEEPCDVCDHHGDLGCPSDEEFSVSDRLDRILDEDNEFEQDEEECALED